MPGQKVLERPTLVIPTQHHRLAHSGYSRRLVKIFGTVDAVVDQHRHLGIDG